MKKIKCISVTVLIISILSLFVIYSNTEANTEPFRCAAQFKQKSFIGNEQGYVIRSNAVLNVFLADKDNGFIKMVGVVEKNNIFYNLNRSMFFSLSPKTVNEMRMATVLKEEVGSTDTTPQDIWLSGIASERPGDKFYIEIKKINKNTLVISSLSSPFLVCVKK